MRKNSIALSVLQKNAECCQRNLKAMGLFNIDKRTHET